MRGRLTPLLLVLAASVLPGYQSVQEKLAALARRSPAFSTSFPCPCFGGEGTKVLHSNYFYDVFTWKLGEKMAFSYKPLWKLLIDKEMTKKQLMQETGISKSTMDKMGRKELVSMEIIDRICTYFSCSIEDVIKHSQDGGANGIQ